MSEADADPAKFCVSWSGKLELDQKTERPFANIPNVMIVLDQDPRWMGVFRYNEMEKRVFVHREMPGWDLGLPLEPRPITDLDLQSCHAWMQKRGTLPLVSAGVVEAAINLTAQSLSYHPVQKSVLDLKWDGVARVDGWLVDYFGTVDTPYTRAIGTMFLVSMMRRLFHPGCKMDYMLVLEGAQGMGKSTACQILAGTEEAYMEGHFKELASVDTAIAIRNKWLVEFGEMQAIRKAEINELKMWLTRQREDYRPKYGKFNVVEPRQCVFIGTSNNSEYLKDETGGRRFWPVLCSKVEIERLRAERDQLIAEAYYLFKMGQPHYPTREFEAEHFKSEQDARRVDDPWEAFLLPVCQLKQKFVDYSLLLQKLNINKANFTSFDASRIQTIMERNGWQKHRNKHGIIYKRLDMPD